MTLYTNRRLRSFISLYEEGRRRHCQYDEASPLAIWLQKKICNQFFELIEHNNRFQLRKDKELMIKLHQTIETFDDLLILGHFVQIPSEQILQYEATGEAQLTTRVCLIVKC